MRSTAEQTTLALGKCIQAGHENRLGLTANAACWSTLRDSVHLVQVLQYVRRYSSVGQGVTQHSADPPPQPPALFPQGSIGLPDIHSGYGFAIGNVAAFDMEDPEAVVSPGKLRSLDQ